MQTAESRPLRRRLSYHAQSQRIIVGVDGRSQEARRFRDIVDVLLAEFGAGADPVALRELAGLKLSCEVTQAALLNGDAKARSDLVRISNLVSRRERELRFGKPTKPPLKPTESLTERMAKKYAPSAKGGPL
jgi:hypothetical protein